jgi:NADPH2:quinone reductase
MRAWRVHELGEPREVLKLEEAEDPKPGLGEIVVQVEAAALNFFDVLLCRGEYQERPELPFTPGAEVSGTVVEIGEGVANLAPGTRVIATPPLPKGGFAPQVVATASGSAFRIPDAMPFSSAAAMHIVYQTAHVGLHRRAALHEGETVLVHAGAGGVGSAAIQLANAAGAACSPRLAALRKSRYAGNSGRRLQWTTGKRTSWTPSKRRPGAGVRT